MIKITLSLVLFFSTLMIAYSVPINENHSLEDVCKMLAQLDKDGKIEPRKKVLEKCAAETLPAEKIEEAKKCKEKFDFEDRETVIKACQAPSEYEAKYQELKACFKNNKPDPSIQMKFAKCVQDGFTGKQ